jgi:O-glycosyl hydrolase
MPKHRQNCISTGAFFPLIVYALSLSLKLTAYGALPQPHCFTTNVYSLDVATRYQVIDNFGANDAWSIQKIGAEWSETNKNKIADLLFSTDKGIGLSFWRFYLGAGVNHQTIRDPWRTAETFETAPGKYDWTRLPGERWFLRAAKARGVQQFGMTVYSPPLRLTRNGLSNLGDDDDSTTNLKPGQEGEFASYLTDVLKHFSADAAERTEFDGIFPVNEPQWEWVRGQEGNRAANADLKKIYTTLHARLEAQGLRTKILGPESGSIPGMTSFDPQARAKWNADYGDYLRLICGDPELAACFGGIVTYHSYWSDEIPDKLVPHREALGRAFTNYPNWKIWQSEYCIMERGRDLGMDAALRMARVIHCDLTLVNASSWQWWLAVANEDFKSGLIYTDYKRPGDAQTIYESKMLWALGNFSRFIRPGMVRVDLSGPQDVNGLMASAFYDLKNAKTVLVFVNCAEKSQNVSLKSALSSSQTKIFLSYLTSADQDLAAGPRIRSAQSFSIPDRSVVTLVSENTINSHQALNTFISPNEKSADD